MASERRFIDAHPPKATRGPSLLRLASLFLRLVALVALLAVLGLAWLWGPKLRQTFAGSDPDTIDAAMDSAQAGAVVRRYEQLIDGDVDRVILSAPELESVLRHELSHRAPVLASSTRVRFEQGEARLRLMVPLVLPRNVPGPLGRIVPDSVPSELTGVIVSTAEGEAAFMLRRIEIAGVPVPRELALSLLRSVDLESLDDVSEGALRLELPPGIGAVYIEDDRLILAGRT